MLEIALSPQRISYMDVCTMSSWCTHGELKAASGYRRYAKGD